MYTGVWLHCCLLWERLNTGRVSIVDQRGSGSIVSKQWSGFTQGVASLMLSALSCCPFCVVIGVLASLVVLRWIQC